MPEVIFKNYKRAVIDEICQNTFEDLILYFGEHENCAYLIRLPSLLLESFQSISRRRLSSWSDGSGDAGSCSVGG